MALLSLQDVSLSIGGKALLAHADLHIEADERVCLAGRNGAGKSTVISLLAGEIQPDSGSVRVAPGTVFGYMPQSVPLEWKGPVLGVVAAGLGVAGRDLYALHLLSAGRERDMSKEEAARARAAQESGQAWERCGEALAVIRRLGLDPDADFAALSGGGQRRAALARALVSSSDLLLDEPTNHLDIQAVLWLEEYLQSRARTLVFVSHDRELARRLATRVVEVDRGALHTYACAYDQFLERREERLEAEARRNAVFDHALRQEEAWLRQGVKARRTRNMGRVRALLAMRAERAGRLDQPGRVRGETISAAGRSGALVFEAERVGFAYPGQAEIIKDFSVAVMRGDRVGVIGGNGTGKSTLLRLLTGELAPDAGRVRQGTNLEIAYFDQMRRALDPAANLMESVAEGRDSVTVGGRTRHVAGYLRDFLFSPEQMRMPVAALSGGERNRLLLARLFARPSNTLILDEPTNDLDVETLELLEELLAEYKGTVLLVSHDRRFLDNVATSVLALEGDGRVREYVGGYTDWVRQRETRAPEVRPEKEPRPNGASGASPALRVKRTFKEQRELELLERELAELPERITGLEEEQAELERRLSEPDLFLRDHALFSHTTARLAEVEQEQTAALERWEWLESRIKELRAADA